MHLGCGPSTFLHGSIGQKVGDLPPNLLDIGHEVVGDAYWMLAQLAAGVRSHWVEVPQQQDAPVLVRCCHVSEHVFLLQHNIQCIIVIAKLVKLEGMEQQPHVMVLVLMLFAHPA